MRRRASVREVADQARQQPYAVAIIAAVVVGVTLIVTGVAVAVGAILAGLAGIGIVVAIIKAAQP